ncbi:hypothetical protein DBIPINDM_004927 [Mesorhizobium sp. AR02]|uniref:hypothetical protein n=1 Tax=Mesorhizobium sp. AR02 TaxID=2865837 RepID=UPI0021607E07|nr:hypothetical protein [Mesorhizobium sp. AR02]UVK51635.1 hypothetical protein DBIPINDM_004927 [Mesorhizobium sp. AR02]
MKALIAFLLASSYAVGVADSAETDCNGKTPGLYVLLSNGDVRPLADTQKLVFDPSARLLYVGSNPSGISESALNIRVTSTTVELYPKRKVSLSRNKIKSICKQNYNRDYIGDDDGKTAYDVSIADYDNHINNRKDRSNRDLSNWNFSWWQSQNGRGECRDTRDSLKPIEAIHGGVTASYVETELSTAVARAQERPIEAYAGVSSVLIHQQRTQRACYAFNLVRGTAQGKTLKASRIEISDLARPKLQARPSVIEWN